MISADQIGEKGRKVKCASCQYTWFQSPDEEVVEKPDEQAVEEKNVENQDQEASPEDQKAEENADDASESSSENQGAEEGGEAANRPLEDDIQEVYGADSLKNQLQEDVPKALLSKKTVTLSASVTILLLLVVGYAIATMDKHPMVKQVYQKIGMIAPELGAGLSLNEMSVEFAENEDGQKTMVITGRLDNEKSHAVDLPDMMISVIDGSGNVAKDWRVEPELTRMEKDQSIILDYSYTDLPKTIQSVSVEFISNK